MRGTEEIDGFVQPCMLASECSDQLRGTLGGCLVPCLKCRRAVVLPEGAVRRTVAERRPAIPACVDCLVGVAAECGQPITIDGATFVENVS